MPTAFDFNIKKSNAHDKADRTRDLWSFKELQDVMKKVRNSGVEDMMVIGIDFGTTYVFDA